MTAIAGVEIGAGYPCRFVAEISNNHNGSIERAIRLIDAAKAAGADFAKFQCYSPDELVALRGDGPAPEPWGSQGWTMRSLYEKARTPFEWFPRLFDHARSIGIVPLSSVFGEESMGVLASVDCPAYKIARLDNQSLRLRLLAKSMRKPLIVSDGGEPQSKLAKPDLRLWCPLGYPQTSYGFDVAFEIDLGAWVPADPPVHYDGFSYHGTDRLPCVVAATLGAAIIEAHIQLDDAPSELEAHVSLRASQFGWMVSDVRRIEAVLAC